MGLEVSLVESYCKRLHLHLSIHLHIFLRIISQRIGEVGKIARFTLCYWYQLLYNQIFPLKTVIL